MKKRKHSVPQRFVDLFFSARLDYWSRQHQTACTRNKHKAQLSRAAQSCPELLRTERKCTKCTLNLHQNTNPANLFQMSTRDSGTRTEQSYSGHQAHRVPPSGHITDLSYLIYDRYATLCTLSQLTANLPCKTNGGWNTWCRRPSFLPMHQPPSVDPGPSLRLLPCPCPFAYF